MDKRERFEVKDDEEQKAKLQDICFLLVAAGYFRARLKGLSAFDKVVGGIVWCLEMCAVDVDVNFLFRENLNIGEKIEITEKIVKVLLSIKCPYSLEPHQIQGLDTVKILPVVQWLVKKAMETRETLAKHLQSVAKIQYQKSFPLPESEVENKRMSAVVPGLITSERKFKLVSGNESLPLEKQVMATLMEYGNNQVNLLEETGLTATQIKSEKKAETRAIAQHVSNLIHEKADVISQAIESYVQRQTEREGDELQRLRDAHKSRTEAIERVARHISNQEQVLDQLNAKLAELIAAQDELNERRESLAALETEENRQILAQLDHLAKLNEQANAERKQFKNDCKIELERLRARNESLASEEVAPVDEEQLKRQVEGIRQQLAGAQKTLGEKNVTLMRLRRQLDAVPSSAELNQYQRRFTELCAQVNEKQTELNGYYLLYNTLEDTKVFLNKQLSLLTSIHDNFANSLSASSSKAEFLQQMESIVAAIRQNKSKIEKQIDGLAEKQRELTRCLNRYAIEEVQYRETLKDIARESQRHRQLAAQLGDEA